eukprot:gene13380-13507_t
MATLYTYGPDYAFMLMERCKVARADIQVTTNQPLGRYWISVGSQYRKGAPAGYAYLTYREATTSPPRVDGFYQPEQLNDKKWSQDVIMSFTPNSALLRPRNGSPVTLAYLAPASPVTTFQLPNRPLDARYLIQSTQPLIEANGILRWAFNNIAHATAPPCKPILDEVYNDPTWASRNALGTNQTFNQSLYFTPIGGNASTWEGTGQVQVADMALGNGFNMLDLNQPGAGTHTLSLEGKKFIEIVIQNNRAGLFGGQYNSSSPLTNNRNGREQHSFHMHAGLGKALLKLNACRQQSFILMMIVAFCQGHHFFQVGMGMGEWTPGKEFTTDYNLETPALRDTVTVLFNGTTEDKAAWVAFRFVTDNPGVWPGLTIIENPAAIPSLPKPANMPSCPEKCIYSHALYSPAAVQAVYGDSGLIAPPDSNLP